MPKTESEKRARKKYDKKTYRLNLVFYPTEADLLDHLKSRSLPMSTYIKGLIREDLGKSMESKD